MPRRFSRHIRTLLLLCAGAAVATAQHTSPTPGATPILDITGLGSGIAPLDGKWQFHTGDDLTWASPTFDDSTWETLVTSQSSGEQGHFGYSGYSWYRRHVSLHAAPGAKPNFSLILESRYGPYEIYWNGQLIGRNGRLPPHPWYQFRPPASSFGIPSAEGVLAIRTFLPPLKFIDDGNMGVIERTPIVGTSAAVKAELGAMDHDWLKSRQFYFDINLLYGIAGVLGLLVWLRNREHHVVFWASIFALMQAIHTLLFNAHMPFRFNLAYGANQFSSSIGDIALWYLVIDLLELNTHRRLLRWTRALAILDVGLAIIACVMVQFDWTGPHVLLFQVVEAIAATTYGLIPALSLVLIGFALGKKVGLANWLVAIAATALEMFNVAATTSLEGVRFTHWHALYDGIRHRLFTINGNYFDVDNICATLLLFAILYAIFRYALQQTNRQNSLEQEFKSAQEVQRILIPETLPPLPGYAVTSAYLPAQEVGGDFFQVFARPAGFAIIVVGDVSGKGLKAAMSVSLIIGSLRAIVDVFHDPAEILSRLNHRLYGRMQGGFATCVVMRLNPDGTCTVANAGHPAPFLNCDELDTPPALPLGLTNIADYECATVQLKVDDRLTLYTDGLLEARNKAGELYGFDRVRSLIATCPDAHQASEAAVAFGQDDDITVLTVTRLASGVRSTTSLKAPELVPTTA